MRQRLTERYRERLAGVLSCYDRIVITGTLPEACYAGGMTRFLSARQIQIFDYPRFAEPLRDRVRERAAEFSIGRASRRGKSTTTSWSTSNRDRRPSLRSIASGLGRPSRLQPWNC